MTLAIPSLIVSLLWSGQGTQGGPGSPTRFDSSRAYEHMRQMVAIGPRPAGSAAIEETRKYIKAQLTAIGLSATEQDFDAKTPAGTIHMVNLLVTIPGGRRDRILVTGHYDTKRERDFRFVGANDGGSSAAFLLELARVLKARKNAFTYELVFLDGEEAVFEWAGTDHTYGSQYYVDRARADGALGTIKANILVDMIADRDLRIRRDDNSTPWLTDAVWAAAKSVKQSAHFLDEHTQIEDDHLPFMRAGVPSVDIIDLEYSSWHTAGDTLDAVSAGSLQVVGDVVVAALPAIEARLGR
jgi:Zn-dependent M28 family amino/carboxypeptidase